MLWTAKGLWLLYVLGIITGAGIMRLFHKDNSWKAILWCALLVVLAWIGALCLITQWVGPVGGGG